MNKKIIAILLIFVMIVGNSVVVFGADLVTGTFTDGNWTYNPSGGNSNDVKANVTLTADDTYSVEITWGALTYTAEADGNWNVTNGNYDIPGVTTWTSTATDTADIVTVTNKSNVGIKATLSGTVDTDFITKYAPSGKYGFNIGSAGVGKEHVLNLEAATPGNPPSGNGKVVISANITKAPQKSINNLKVGTITVTLDKATP